MLKKVALALAGLLAVGVTFLPQEASAMPGWRGGWGWHGGFARRSFFHPGFVHRPFFHHGFVHRPVFFHRPFFHHRFIHRPVFFHRRHFFGPRVFVAGAYPAAFYGPSCIVKKRVRWTPWGPILRVKRICF